MAQLPYSYSIAVGSSVALGSLANIEDLLWNYTKPRRLTAKTAPVNRYPVRTMLGSGRERGDGQINHAWLFEAIPQTAVTYLYSYFSWSSAVSTAVTIYTRLHPFGTYARYNAYAVLPVPGQDIEMIGGGAFDVYRLNIRFTNLEAL